MFSVKIDRNRLAMAMDTELRDLPPLPLVIVRISEMVNDPKTSATELNRLICSDTALAAKILRLVNSAHYGLPQPVSSVTQAIVILGFSAVRNLAMALGIAGALPGNGKSALNREHYWAHSMATAIGASAIAFMRGFPPRVAEQVFAGGMLHDMGKIFLDRYFPFQYKVAIGHASVEESTILEAENESLGINHANVGHRMAQKWNLPAELTAMISHHHAPQDAGDHFEVAAIVHAANWLTHDLKIGNSGYTATPEIDPDVEGWLCFSTECWAIVRAATWKKYDDSKAAMKISLR